MARLPRDNNDAEIAAFDAVCDRLGGFDDRVSPEWVDGYITATATRPLPLLVGDWLPRMAGDAYDRAFADPEDRLQAERALRTRAGVIADQLDAEALFDDPGRMRLAPLMAEWDDAARAEVAAERGLSAEEAAEFVTGGLWADGFMQAVEDHGEEPVAGEEDAFAELLRAVHALRLAEGSDALREHLVATYGRQGADRDQLVDDALYAVQDLRMLRVDSAPVPATRRVEKTPGRNDPCPCGSGRKFKKCHGA